MRIIFTQEDKKVVRKNIDSYRVSYIIDVREMILKQDYVAEPKVITPMDFIVQRELEKKLKQAINNKKSTQVIYFHYQISPFLIKNIKAFFKSNGATFKFALYDPTGELSALHKLFDEVLA